MPEPDATQTVERTGSPVLTLRNVSVSFDIGANTTVATDRVNLVVHPREIVALVGESGSGKSVTGLSVLRLLPPTARLQGEIELDGQDVTAFGPQQLRQMRGRDVAMIFQEPMTALNPVFTIGAQIVEMIRLHTTLSRKDAKARAIELLGMVGLPNPQERVGYYPHQLSGGQRQRAMIAMAISCEPKILIADEPTTALDVTVQAEILELLRELRHRISAAIVLITHDMGVVADIADRVVVMKDGQVVEEALVDDLFAAPQHPYTQLLLGSVPRLGQREPVALSVHNPALDGPGYAEKAGNQVPASAASVPQGLFEDVMEAPQAEDTVLSLTDLVVEYPGGLGRPAFRAVDQVDLQICRGEVMGLVGESGSGKSTIGRAVVGLQPASQGRIIVAGYDITHATSAQMRPLRRKVGMVFQDPASSLNPRYSIGDSIGEPLRLHQLVQARRNLDAKIAALLEKVELPTTWRDRFPHELSGGQRQRVAIARALAVEPELLVADEPTSALDVSVQARLLDLLLGLQDGLGFSCLFISHDLAVVELLSDRIAVMSQGKIVEHGSRAEVLGNPAHDYTKRLLAAAPVPDPQEQRRRRSLAASLVG